jgi:transposase
MAYKINLTPKEQKELLKRKRNQRDAKILRRLLCIDMKSKGVMNKEIAEYCNVCIDTITDWLCLFEEGSFDALCSLQYEGRRISRLEKYKEEIQKKGKEENIASLKELKEWIQKEYGVQTCISNLFYFCKKNSIFLTKKQD